MAYSIYFSSKICFSIVDEQVFYKVDVLLFELNTIFLDLNKVKSIKTRIYIIKKKIFK